MDIKGTSEISIQMEKSFAQRGMGFIPKGSEFFFFSQLLIFSLRVPLCNFVAKIKR